MAKCSPALPVSSSPQPVQLQLKLDQQAQASSSQLLERGFNLLRAVIQQGGTGEAAVLQFLEKLERLGEDRGQLEDALTRFGTDQWDWFMPDSTVGAVLNSASGEAQTQVKLWEGWDFKSRMGKKMILSNFHWLGYSSTTITFDQPWSPIQEAQSGGR